MLPQGLKLFFAGNGVTNWAVYAGKLVALDEKAQKSQHDSKTTTNQVAKAKA